MGDNKYPPGYVALTIHELGISTIPKIKPREGKAMPEAMEEDGDYQQLTPKRRDRGDRGGKRRRDRDRDRNRGRRPQRRGGEEQREQVLGEGAPFEGDEEE